MISRWLRKSRARKLLATGAPRSIRIHSVTPQPDGAPNAQYLRVAFEFLDPPGPWSMQFYNARADQPDISNTLNPGANAKFYESDDQARTRVLATDDGRALWPW